MSKSNLRCSDVACFDPAVVSFKGAFLLPLKYPLLFQERRSSWNDLLFLAKGLDTVADAVNEDSKRNYPRALELYEQSLECYLSAMEYEELDDQVKDCLRKKCDEYSERAEEIRKYLHTEMEDSIEKGIDTVTEAVNEDIKHNYPRALELYDQSLECFLSAMKYEELGDKVKDSIRKKCDEYSERAEKIRKYLHTKMEDSIEEAIDSETDSTEEEDKKSDYAQALELCDDNEECFHCSVK